MVTLDEQSEVYTSVIWNDADSSTPCDANGPDGIPTRYSA